MAFTFYFPIFLKFFLNLCIYYLLLVYSLRALGFFWTDILQIVLLTNFNDNIKTANHLKKYIVKREIFLGIIATVCPLKTRGPVQSPLKSMGACPSTQWVSDQVLCALVYMTFSLDLHLGYVYTRKATAAQPQCCAAVVLQCRHPLRLPSLEVVHLLKRRLLGQPKNSSIDLALSAPGVRSALLHRSGDFHTPERQFS